MKHKPVTPYARLLNEFSDWVRKCLYRHSILMWTYPKTRLAEGWTMEALYERINAAKQLGYEVVLEVSDKGIEVWYRKNLPPKPYCVD